MPVDSPSLQPKTFFQGKKQLKQNLEQLTQQMYRHNKELADTNRTLSLLRAIDEIVLAPHTSMKEACADIANAVSGATEFPFVGLFVRSAHNHDELALYGWSARDKGASTRLFTKSNPMRLHIAADRWFSEPDVRKLFALSDLSLDSLSAAMVNGGIGFDEVGRKLNLKALYLSKLIVRRHLVGLLVVGFDEPITSLSESDEPLLERLSDSIGVALDNKLLFEENQYVLRRLSETNQKLRELDDIKDDFISMASHQLRTPLTSVKGYLSMMIDGDAGKVTPTQDKMLHQAFISAQRMVFLITDLLNVSRLKTGKFIIDAQPTNLAQLIQEEVDQLVETAAAKKLKLRFKQPAAFPELMLDEVKTRQVAMNFIDNAIYYTPEGGHIDVELVDRPRIVELHVTDDGIGVPKSEQHHLFTKFYRAANARKARPDGTGLGLFMAQKVILAQGGSIIFHSKEDQGSTFGFSFPKDKLRVPPVTASPQPELPPES